MTLQIHTRGRTLEPELRETIEQEIASTFRRVEPSVVRIHVHLEDVNGPRGGDDKEVRLEVALRGAPGVIVAQRGATWRSVIHSATQRAWHSTMRRLDRRKKRQSRPSHGSFARPLPFSALDHAREEMF